MHLLVHITASSREEAERIGRALVEERLAACANLIPGVTSLYTWEGKTCESSEVLIEAKTTASAFEDLARRVRELHSYDIPEIVALPVQTGSPEYLRWVSRSIRGGEADPAPDPPDRSDPQ